MINYNDYLRDIGISDGVIKDRVDEIISYFGSLYDNTKLKRIFISEYITEDGNRNYTSLWLIYENIICEAKNFINETDFDSIYYKTNHIFYWNLKSKEKIKDEFKDSDRLSLMVQFDDGMTGTFKASKNNCKYLLQILREHFIEKQ